MFWKRGDRGGGEKATSLKWGQKGLWGAAALAGFATLWFVVGWFQESSEEESFKRQKVPDIATPISSVPDSERWVARVEKEAREAKERVAHLEKRVEMQSETVDQAAGVLMRGMKTRGQILAEGGRSKFVKPQETSVSESSVSNVAASPVQTTGVAMERVVAKKRWRRSVEEKPVGVIHVSSLKKRPGIEKRKHVDTFVAANTHAPGVLLTGLTAYTGVGAVQDPEQLIIRLTDFGKIVKDWKVPVKDAKISAGCWGELSSERARCRLKTLTLVEENGEIIELPVKGWIQGEDGRGGLRGVVIDRAGELVRDSFFAGILGGISSYFQNASQSVVGPISALGQRNQLNGKDLMKSGAAGGAGSALEKLADYAIKKAEKIEPVLVVDAGRRVDVVFAEGFDVTGTKVREELKRLGERVREEVGAETARLQGAQGGSL